MIFHVYEDWTHDRSRAHRSDCVFSNEGRGIRDSPSNQKGQRHGPFETIDIASRMAKALGHSDANVANAALEETWLTHAISRLSVRDTELVAFAMLHQRDSDEISVAVKPTDRPLPITCVSPVP